MGPSDFLIKRILDRNFGAQDWSAPSTLYFALFTTLPDDADSGGVEVTGGSYVRKAVTNNNSNFPDSVMGTGAKNNGEAITFITPSASWGSVIGIAVYDEPVTGGASQNFTTTHGSDLVNLTSHGYVDGQALRVSTSGTLPAGYSADTTYYVRDVTANSFKLAATLGGSAVAITTDGSGTHTATKWGNLLFTWQQSPISVSSGQVFSIAAGAMQIQLSSDEWSDYFIKRVLDYYFGGQGFTVPALYFALFTVAPDTDGTGGTEVSGNAYVRKQVTNNSTEWPDATSGTGLKSNANSIAFASPTPAGWGDVVAQAAYDAATGGNLLLVKTIPTTTVAVSSAWTIPAGDVDISLA